MIIDQGPSHYPAELFTEDVGKSFGFLEDYGLRRVGSSMVYNYSTVTYGRSGMHLRVRFDEYRGEIDVDLARVDEVGNIPAYHARPDHWISADMLAAYRTQGQEIAPKPSLDQQVSYYADLLKRHAGDVLSGDLTVFPAVRQFIVERAVAAGQPQV